MLAGALAGWRRGFIVPLVTLGCTLLALSQLYGGPGASLVPAGAFGIAIGAAVVGIVTGVVLRVGGALTSLIHRVSLLRAADHTLGAPLGAATALVGIYISLVAVVSVDGFLAPLHGKASIDEAAVAVMKATIASQPQFGVIADPAILDQMATAAATEMIPREKLADYERTLAFYEESFRPQLLASSLAPVIVRLGEYLPIIGRHLNYPKE